MQKIRKILSHVFLIFCLSILLLACEKVTQKNFEQIKPDMTMEQVIAILGEPTSSQSVNIAGISGTSAIWKNNNSEINVQFLNDRVAVKTFNKLDNDKPKEQTDQTKQP